MALTDGVEWKSFMFAQWLSGVIWPSVDDVIVLMLGAVSGNHRQRQSHECALIED